MKLFHIISFACIVASGTSFSAWAPVAGAVAHAQLRPQQQTGSRFAVKPVALPEEQLGIVKKRFAQCIYRRQARHATALLNHSDNVTVDLATPKLVGLKAFGLADCIGDDMMTNDQLAIGLRFQPAAFRDLMAEEAYLTSHDAAPIATPQLPLVGKFVSSGDQLAKARTLASFSDCTILADIGKAGAVLRTMPGSPGERIAVKALGPTLGSCLFEGQQISLTTGSVRALLAFGMWNRFVRKGAVE